jgi:hypothetical protein
VITEKVLPASIAISSLGLTIAVALQSHWVGAAFCAPIGLLWIITLWIRWDAFSSLWFFCQGCLSIAAYMLGVSPFLILVFLLLSLGAWDLQLFIRRLEKVKPVENARRFEKRHLLRLAGVLGAGLALGSIALLVHISLRFWLAFLLSVFAMWGVHQAFTHLVRRRREDEEGIQKE